MIYNHLYNNATRVGFYCIVLVIILNTFKENEKNTTSDFIRSDC